MGSRPVLTFAVSGGRPFAAFAAPRKRGSCRCDVGRLEIICFAVVSALAVAAVGITDPHEFDTLALGGLAATPECPRAEMGVGRAPCPRLAAVSPVLVTKTSLMSSVVRIINLLA